MQSSKSKRNIQWDKYMVYIIFAVVFVLFALILGNKGFLQPRNLINILRQTAMISVMSVAGVFVLASGTDRSDGRLYHRHDRHAGLPGPAGDQ